MFDPSCRDIVIPDASPSFSFIVQDGGCCLIGSVGILSYLMLLHPSVLLYKMMVACLIGFVGILSYLVLLHPSVLLYKMVVACLLRFCRDIVIPGVSPSFSFIVQNDGCMFDWFCRDIVIPGAFPFFSFIAQKWCVHV